jgi:Kef-type K+ transport system membrane component KefB
MSLSTADFVHLTVVGVLLLAMAHGLGRLFARFRQPRVAGELLGGLVLGPTLFGLVAPGWQTALFGTGTATQVGLGIAYSSACCC